MAAESKLQKKVRLSLKRKGWWVNKIILCSINGWPDIYAIKKLKKSARHVWIEMKAPDKEPDDLQKYVHEQLRNMNAEVYVISNWEEYLKLNL